MLTVLSWSTLTRTLAWERGSKSAAMAFMLSGSGVMETKVLRPAAVDIVETVMLSRERLR